MISSQESRLARRLLEKETLDEQEMKALATQAEARQIRMDCHP
jgi:hypothetical protein